MNKYTKQKEYKNKKKVDNQALNKIVNKIKKTF